MPLRDHNNLVEITVDFEISTSAKCYILTSQGSDNVDKYFYYVEVFQTISFFLGG